MTVIREMTTLDIESVIPFYIEYYNDVDGNMWTRDTVYTRIHQVLTTEGACSLIACDGDCAVGFVMGYLQQYDDLVAYNLAEIVVAHSYQNTGIGTELMREIEARVKARGAAMIQLEAENDEMHAHFYGEKLDYKKSGTFVSMVKFFEE